MGYGNNHYNYQIAVIFAILIGAVLLLLLVLLGIWFITKSMRGDDEEKKRYQSGRNSVAQWPSQAPSYRPSSQHQNQSYEFPPARSPVNPVAPSPMNVQNFQQQPSPYQPNQQYSQVPLVTPVNQGYIDQNRTSQLQPDVIYTQGPAGFVRSTPVEYTSYHQSSV